MSYIIYSAREKRKSNKRIEKIEVEIFMWRFDHPAKAIQSSVDGNEASVTSNRFFLIFHLLTLSLFRGLYSIHLLFHSIFENRITAMHTDLSVGHKYNFFNRMSARLTLVCV